MTGEPAAERLPGLDLLRSLAIVLVFAAHCAKNMSYWYGVRMNFGVLFAGDMGVELFFALSGFLIGRILIEIAVRAPTGRSLFVFLVRRWLRTLPAYFVWLGVLLIFFPPPAQAGLHWLRFATLTQNLLRPMPADNWFAVSWSLTVEEWFYLLFGIGAVLSARVLGRAAAIWVPLAVLLAAPPALRFAVSGSRFLAEGYWTMVPFRLDEIGYGVVMAWLAHRRSRLFALPVTAWLIGTVVVAIAWLQWLPVSEATFGLFRHTLAVAGFSLWIPAGVRIRRLGWGVGHLARRVSRLAYGIYLVHSTVLVAFAQTLWFEHRISAGGAVAVSLLGTIVMAELLSRCVERPFMRLRPVQFAGADGVRRGDGPALLGPGTQDA